MTEREALQASRFRLLNGGTDYPWLVDVNNDGNLDLVVARNGATTIRLGDGAGNFGTDFVFGTDGNYSVAIDDFNGDGNPDFAQNGGAAEFQLFLGAGNGRFGTPAIETGTQPNSTTTADFNGDGKPDFAVSDYYDSKVSVLTNTGSGNFSNTTTQTLNERPWSIFSGDFDNDGDTDIGTINWNTGSAAAAEWRLRLITAAQAASDRRFITITDSAAVTLDFCVTRRSVMSPVTEFSMS